jgi:alpha-L-arabinofuranosidase
MQHIALCNALGIEPVLTISGNTNSPLDIADLLEYCYGGAETAWGAQRIADGHNATFNISFLELGKFSFTSSMPKCFVHLFIAENLSNSRNEMLNSRQ